MLISLPNPMPRRFKILLWLLLLSNIATGLFAFESIRAVDRKYSSLVAQAVPALNDLHTLSALAVEAMYRTNPELLTAEPRGEGLGRARGALAADRQLRAALLPQPWLSGLGEKRDAFETAGSAFSRAAAEFLETNKNASAADLRQRRDASLRPVFQRYLSATSALAETLTTESLHQSDSLSTQTGSVSRLFLAAGNWPLAIFGGLLLLSAAILVFVSGTSLLRPEEDWRT